MYSCLQTSGREGRSRLAVPDLNGLFPSELFIINIPVTVIMYVIKN